MRRGLIRLCVRLAAGDVITLEPGIDREQADWMISAGRVIDADGHDWSVRREDVVEVARCADPGEAD